jgi:hypothetical protein
MTPTFKCLKEDDLHHAKVGDVIKMSPKSLIECDKLYKGWRKKYRELDLEEELKELNK